MQGVELEKKGKVFEAMRMYRSAVHIDPDIEFKMYEALKTTTQSTNKNSKPNENNSPSDGSSAETPDEEDLSDVDLTARFKASIVNGNGNLFKRDNAEKGVIVTDGCHFSDLPMEIILYILRWVVGNNLDLRSLEVASAHRLYNMFSISFNFSILFSRLVFDGFKGILSVRSGFRNLEIGLLQVRLSNETSFF